MAAAVVFPTQSLISLALQEANRIANVKEPIESLEKELLLMNAFIESVEAMVEPDQNAIKWMEKTSIVVRRAEDLISQYEKSLAKKKGPSILKWPYLKERYRLALELEIVALEIHNFSEEGKRILINRNLNLPFLSQEAGGNISNSSLNRLNVFLRQNWFLPKKLLERLKAIRDEMVLFDQFLKEVEAEAEFDKRQEVWVQEIRDIFQLLEEFLLFFHRMREEEFEDFKCFRPFMIVLLDFLRVPLRRLQMKIMKIEKRIAAVSSRYHLYGIGEFKVRGGLRSIVPQIMSNITMEPVKSSSMMAEALQSDKLGITAKLLREKPSVFVLEQFTMDLKLMEILFEDATKMDHSNKRIKVWLQQMGVIYYRLLSLEKDAKEMSERRMGVRRILSVPKIVRETKEIEKEMHDLLIRKMKYDIGSFMAKNGRGEVQSITAFGSVQSTFRGKLEEQVQLMKELQLMDALMDDISTMEKLDTRLKVWLQEIKGVAREAKAIAEKDFKGILGRIRFARKVHKINKWIDDIGKWKRTYDIGEIKVTNGSGRISHDIEAAKAYPSGIVRAEFESLRRETKLMKALDSDIQELVGIDGKLEVWMEEMRAVAKDAEKCIDKHDQITRKRGIQYILHLFFLYEEIITQDKNPNGILHIKNKIQELHKRRLRYGIEKINRIPTDNAAEVTSMLLSDVKHLGIFPILDPKGTGNATLHELIMNHDVILGHFDWCVWVTLSEDFSSLNILRAIIDQVEEQEEKKRGNATIKPLVLRPRARQKEMWSEEEEMMQKLEGILIQKRYLIVLYGIQSVEVWHYFQKAFPDAANGSRIILVTQNTVESKWKQLCQNMALGIQTDQEVEAEGQGKLQLLTPLTIGGLLPENETVSDWDRLLMQLDEEETLGPESSTVNHENAPSYLWRCLFYFLLFPAGMEVPARRLIALWVAEGLIGPKRGEDRPAEYFCELYLYELIRRRMIRAKRRPNGKVRSCQLCDNVREILLKRAEEANFLQDESNLTFRLKVHYADRNTSNGHIDGSIHCHSSELKARYEKVISFLSFDTEEGGKHGENIGNFLQRCISNRCFLSLRVLDLEHVFKPKLPSALGILTGLRYLGLRWSYMESLPDFVSKLLNLLVLDVKRTYISTLPRSIWSMQYLRHLYLSETYRTRFVDRPRNKSLTDLLTLWGAFIDEDSPVLNGLDTILNVRKLGLTCRPMSSTDKMESQLIAVGDWILKLEHLEHLRLKSFDDLGNPSDLHLMPLSGHKNLSTVYLVGKLRYPSIVSEFPVNLTDITLSGSELQKNPMDALQKLKKLIILRLLSRSSTCNTMRCTKGGFPQLRVLKIWNLQHLVKLEIEKGALPILKDLEIRNCQNLKMIPPELTSLESLREFKLSDKFAEDIKDQQPIVWDKLEHLLKVDS